MTIFISNQSEASAQYNYDFEKITNKLSIKVPIKAERYSDLSYKAFNNKSNLYNENLTRTDSQGLSIIDFQLGLKSDQREGCISTINLRRTGICEDGFYTFNFIATDGAGNSGEVFEFKIERDTVAPQVPNANLSICGKDICLNITSAESSTFVLANNSQVGQITANSHSFVVLRNFIEDSTYSYNISLMDLAQNISDPLELSIHTPSFGIGGVGEINYNRLNERFPNQIDAEFLIDENGHLHLIKFNLPAPIIDYIDNEYDTDKVTIYGIGVPKDYSYNITATIKRQFLQFSKVSEICNFDFTNELILAQYDCLVNSLQISLQELLILVNERRKICMEHKDQDNNYRMCIENYSIVKDYKRNINLKLDHVELLAYKNYDQNLIIRRDCEVGQNCYDLEKRYWHSNPIGSWEFRVGKNTLKVGDKVTSKLRFFSDHTLNLFGKNYMWSNGEYGQESPWSNEVEVGESRTFFNSRVNPLSHPTCKGTILSSDYGYRPNPFKPTEWVFHDGVDLAKSQGCIIVSVFDGDRYNLIWAGNTVDIYHKNTNIVTRYGHGSTYLNENNRSTKTSEPIMYMGRSGAATGVHLHFTVIENGSIVNPWKYFTF